MGAAGKGCYLVGGEEAEPYRRGNILYYPAYGPAQNEGANDADTDANYYSRSYK